MATHPVIVSVKYWEVKRAELAEAMIQVMNVCGITAWGQTGYKVLDEARRLEGEDAQKRKAAARKPRPSKPRAAARSA